MLTAERLETRAMLSASPSGLPNLGILLLDPTSAGAAYLTGNANVTVTQGDFAIDSTSSSAGILSGNGHLTASNIYVAGRITNVANARTTGTMHAGWTAEADFLAALVQPSGSNTTFAHTSINNRAVTLSPGIYVNGITITGNSNVTLLPGLYYLQGGLTVNGNGKLTGTGVTIFNASGAINLSGNANIKLSAPTSGAYQGIALFQSRTDSAAISSDATLNLIGEIYASDATLNLYGNANETISGNGSTIPGAVIIRDLSMSGNGHLSVTTNSGGLTGDLSITKTDNADGSSITGATGTVSAGGTITYTIIIANSGPSAAIGATVRDPFPTGITGDMFTIATTGGAVDVTHSTSGSGNIADTVDLPSGSTITYSVIASISESLTGSLSNSATVAAPNGFTDPKPSNNTATDIDTQDADLVVTKTDSAGGSSDVFSSQFAVLQTFDSFDNLSGVAPISALTLFGSKLYGETSNGGQYEYGEVFSMNTDGTGFTVLRSFDGSDGNTPIGGLAISSDGSTLYGVTKYGGVNGDFGPLSGDGDVFSLSTDGSTFNVLHAFNGTDGVYPFGGLTLSGSTLYGMTQFGGSDSLGDVFKISADGTNFDVLASFTAYNPLGLQGLSQTTLTVSGSTIYGTTFGGGANSEGEVFSLGTNGGKITALHSFDAMDGENPAGGLTLSGSTLYGSTSAGGANGDGELFRINTNGTGFSVVYAFDGEDGDYPVGELALSGSTLIGTTNRGGGGYGVVFGIATSGALLGEYQFSAGGILGSSNNGPFGAIALSGSTIYGSTSGSSDGGYGEVFSLGALPQVVAGGPLIYTVTIANNGPSNARNVSVSDSLSNIAVIADSYTAVGSGGATGFTASGTGGINDTVNLPVGASITYTVTAEISSTASGTLSNTATATSSNGETNINPTSVAGVTSATDSDTLLPDDVDIEVSKTDSAGGTSDGIPGSPTQVFSFDGIGAPESNLTAFGSKLYGEMDNEVYRVDADGTGFTVLGGEGGGFFPLGGLAVSSDGSTLYGTTTYGGSNDYGEVFSLSTSGGPINVLYSFTGGSDGGIPLAGVTLSGSTLYGTTATGGADGSGTIFSIHTDGTNFATLASFDFPGSRIIHDALRIVMVGGVACDSQAGLGRHGGC